jgi:dipeptidyl-peptidase-4
MRTNLRYLIPLAAALGAGIGPAPLARGSGAAPDRLTLDRVARYPPPGAGVAGGFKFSHNGSYLYFLKGEEPGAARSLYREDVKTGARELVARPPAAAEGGEPLTREEILRRERQRIQDKGITLYVLASKADVAAFAHGGAVHLVRPGRDPLRLTDPARPAIDPQLSPDGSRLAFARDGEVYVLDVATGAERRLTTGARDGVTHGIAEYVAQEEMDRDTGFWWSPGGDRIAYAEVDETGIPLYPIVHQGKADREVESHRYPFAGGPNARVRLGVVAAAGGETRWLPPPPEDGEGYLARVEWDRDGTLLVQVQSRDQRTLRLLRFDTASGTSATLLEDRSDAWVNLHDDLRPLRDGRFLWSGEGSGFRHLELRARNGSPVKSLTSGDWPVDRLEGVDEAAGYAYFTAAKDGPLQRQLYRVRLEGGAIERVTSEPGWHDTTFSDDGRFFVDVHQSAAMPPRASLREGSGRVARLLDPNQDPEVGALSLKPPEFVTLRAADGSLLHGAIYKPEIEPGRRYPALVRVYGGPTAQTVKDSWEVTQDLRAQYLARHGYVIFRLDNRGTPRRGRAFETALHRRLGSVEVEDQVAGARYVAGLPYVDGSRLGVYGWSYGGYMAALCLLKAPDLFRAAVAGAPVADWDGYDTHYTERYMGTPRDNSGGYHGSSVLPLAPRLQGALLIVHGMIDENVHFRHTARLIDALNTAGKTYDLLIFPDERHLPRGEEDRRHLEGRLVAHFERHLDGPRGALRKTESPRK